MGQYLFPFNEIMNVRNQISDLSQKEKGMLSPLSDDMSLINGICQHFIAESCGSMEPGWKERRKRLFFVIFVIFCPKVLCGGKMPNGMRKEILKAFPGLSPCVISNSIKEISFRYLHDREFREEAEDTYLAIKSKFGL